MQAARRRGKEAEVSGQATSSRTDGVGGLNTCSVAHDRNEQRIGARGAGLVPSGEKVGIDRVAPPHLRGAG